MNASWYWTPPSPEFYIVSPPTATLEQSLRAIRDAASQAAVLILPQIELTTLKLYIFFSWHSQKSRAHTLYNPASEAFP